MRLRVPASLVVLGLVTLLYIWLGSGLMRQIQVIASTVVLGLTLLTLFLWFVAFSGAGRRVRIGVAIAAVLIVLLSTALLRVRSFTGDLIPILEYRFAAARVLPEARPGPSIDAADPRTAGPAAEPVGPTISPDRGGSGGLPTAPAHERSAALIASTVAARETAITNQDWPQYLGPRRSGEVPDVDLETNWTARPPRLLWRHPVGAGWAGFAVSSGIAVTLEQRGEDERVIAYDVRTGHPLWSHGDRALHDSPLGGLGPRSVPFIDGGQVFAQGATGLLNALDLRTGRLLWSRNTLRDNSGTVPDWGVSISPLVHGGRVIVSVGGAPGRALVAYDRNTGEPSWAAGNGGLAYSSPVLMNLAGREQVVMLNKDSVAGHDPETGAELWTEEFPRGQPNVAQPLAISPNRVLFSVGYGIGSKVFEISNRPEGGLSSRLIWSTRRLKSKFANMILFKGSVYGLDDGVLACLDPETGERRWKDGRFGHGQLILSGEHLLIQTEDGQILLVEPNSERLIEIARFPALDGKTWNPPAFAAPILLVRNDLEAAAYELPVAR